MRRHLITDIWNPFQVYRRSFSDVKSKRLVIQIDHEDVAFITIPSDMNDTRIRVINTTVPQDWFYEEEEEEPTKKLSQVGDIYTDSEINTGVFVGSYGFGIILLVLSGCHREE
jgi:hypothetical protein